MRIAALAGAILISLGLAVPAPPQEKKKEEPKYVGVEKCEKCHKTNAEGNQVGIWKASRHAKAFDTLASKEALAIAEKHGVENPQKDPKCLKCHTTAFGVAAERLADTFKPENVQCEACHGPASIHAKSMKASDTDGEPGLDVCRACHNEESPSFKPFCFRERAEKIRHLNPDKERESPPAKCACDAGKCACKKGECGDP